MTEKRRCVSFSILVPWDYLSNRLCHTGTSREQHVSPPLGDEGLDLFHLLDVIEDEQPVGVRMKPAFDGLNDARLLGFVLFWEVEQTSKFYEISDQHFRGIGLHPQDGLVVRVVAIEILDRCLALPMPPSPLMACGCVKAVVWCALSVPWRRSRISSRPVK